MAPRVHISIELTMDLYLWTNSMHEVLLSENIKAKLEHIRNLLTTNLIICTNKQICIHFFATVIYS